MNGLAIVAAAAAVAAPFAPPPGVSIPYRTVQLRPLRAGGEARVALDETLRFTARGDGLEASLVAGDVTFDAPEPTRSLIAVLFGSYGGQPITVRLDRQGAVTGVVDGAAAWAAARASQAAMLRRMDGDAAIPPADKARAHALSAATFDLDDAARDTRLADTVGALLPPPLPALAPGETRAFRTELQSPQGRLASSGEVTLVRVDADMLAYRIVTRSDPAATQAAVAAMLAAPAASPAARERAEAAARALAGATYVERTELVIDRANGLLRRASTSRLMLDEGGGEHPIDASEITRR